VVQSKLADFTEPMKETINRFEVKDGFVTHPLINPEKVIAKGFQLSIASKAIGGSTLVVLPTGIGKTIIAILVSAEVLRNNGGKVVMVAPTRPLVDQHRSSFETFMVIDSMVTFTGSMKPDKRVEEWINARLIFSTPQTMNNDLGAGRYDLKDVSLLIIDEAHRCVGDYAYTGISSHYEGLVLALTASPGGDDKKIMEVVDNLKVEQVEARTDLDDDVRPHIKGIEVEWIRSELTDGMKEIKKLVDDFLLEKVKKLRKLGFVRNRKANLVSKKDILLARDEILKRYARNKGLMFGSIHNQSQAVLAYHCIELLETQGVNQCRSYLERMERKEKKSKSEIGFLRDERIIRTKSLTDRYRGPPHPKMEVLESILRESVKRNETAIVFTQIRDTIPLIMERLDGLRVRRFVGQAKGKDGKGLKQKEQKEILDQFRKRQFDVLLATSVGEEGIDIPDVDLVVFYEPIPSEIRTIQRRGRTGRSSRGRVVVLITSETRDEAYFWAERSRERKMGKVITWLSAKHAIHELSMK
jgi:ERCC4-related helicase